MKQEVIDVLSDYKDAMSYLVTDKDKQSLSDHTLRLLVDEGMSPGDILKEMKAADGGTFAQKSHDDFVAAEKRKTDEATADAARKAAAKARAEQAKALVSKGEEWAKGHFFAYTVIVIALAQIVWVVRGFYYTGVAAWQFPFLMLVFNIIVVVATLWVMATKDLGRKSQVAAAAMLVVATFVISSLFWGRTYGVLSSDTAEGSVATASASEGSVAAETAPPRPKVAGRDLSDLDMYVFGMQENEAANFAYYGLVYSQWGEATVIANPLFAVKDWMAKWNKEIPAPSAEDISRRTKELVLAGGGKDVDSEGKVILQSETQKEAFEGIVATLTR